MESKIDLNRIINSISEAIVEINSNENGYVVAWCNKQASEIFEKNILGLQIDELFNKEDSLLIEDSIKSQNYNENKKITICNKVYKMSYIPQDNDDSSIILILNDVTEYDTLQNSIDEKTETLKIMNDLLEEGMRKGLEENRKIISQLHKKEKLASMGELISNLAHHWRQPLSVITSASTGMIVQQQLELLNTEILEESCKRINDHAQFLSKTIEDFSSFVNTDEEEREFDINDTVREVLVLVHPLTSQGKIKIVSEIEANLLLVSYYTDMIQVLKNIIKNSLDAFVKNDIKEPCITMKAYKKDKSIYLSISDNGGGVDEEFIDKIYEPYFTTKHQSQGTGLGLTMVYNFIVNILDGKIEMKNKDNGAELSMEIPISR